MSTFLSRQDPELASLLNHELKRQQFSIELIPSENIVSPAVLEALGSVLTNKYSEGYPGARYYAGNAHIDEIERLAVSRAKALFGVDHVNIQPYSGSGANFAVYNALLEPGDTILAMGLPFGGHLTHGWKVSATGKYFRAVHYPTGKDGRIDYEMVAELALKEKPKLIVCGASAYPRMIDFKHFREIADSVHAYLMADIAHIAGLVVGGVHPSPVPYADVITTTLHKTLRGPRGAMIMCREELAAKIDKSIFPGLQGGPHNHVTAAAAVAFKEAATDEFRAYTQQVVTNASALAQTLIDSGFPLVSGGTDNHLMLLDLSEKSLTGKDAEDILADCSISTNKNMIPNDPRTPMNPSGIRIGTPLITSRGFTAKDSVTLGVVISSLLRTPESEEVRAWAKSEVRTLCEAHPIYGTLSY